MYKTIKECIEYAYNNEFIFYGNYVDLLNDLDELIDESIKLDELKDEKHGEQKKTSCNC